MTTKPRTRSTRSTSHKKKAAPPAPELEAMVDTLEDSINPDAVESKEAKPRQQKPGPKKVLSETSKIVGDGLAVGVLRVTSQPDQRKNLTLDEAKSIGHPIVRLLARRIPNWLKPYLPKSSLSPEDAADLEEIAATLAKWGVRLLTVMVQDYIDGREKPTAERQQKQAVHNSTPAARTPVVSLEAAQIEPGGPQPSANGHNPAFDVLNSIDLGVEAG